MEASQDKIRELCQRLEKSFQDRAASLSGLKRGSDFIHSAVSSLTDLFTSFQTYLSSVEKNGVTPISQRTGQMLIENWSIQRDNLVKLAGMLSELMEASSRIQETNLAHDRAYAVSLQIAEPLTGQSGFDGSKGYHA